MYKRVIAIVVVLVVVGALAAEPARAQVGQPWRGYILIEFTGSLAQPMDENRRLQVKQAFEMFAPTRGDYPPYLLQVLVRPDRKAVLVEARFNALPSRAEAIREIAYRTGLSQTLISNNLTFTLFGADTATWIESWQAVMQYMADNRAAWSIEQ